MGVKGMVEAAAESSEEMMTSTSKRVI